MNFPVAGAVPKFRTPPVMVLIAVFWIIEIGKEHGSWNRGGSSPRMTGDRDGICRTDSQHNHAAASAAVSFDFIAIAPLRPNRRSAGFRTTMSIAVFWTTEAEVLVTKY
jgi:hypothetical protein